MLWIVNEIIQQNTKMNSKVNNSAKEESKDEVDFVPTAKKEIIATSKSYNPLVFVVSLSTNYRIHCMVS